MEHNVNNIPPMEHKVADAELVLLLLIAENPEINGYKLKQLVDNRGMREWAGVGMSSIYMIVKKLEQKGLIRSKIDEFKTTKGPRGKLFSISEVGQEVLLSEIELALSSASESSQRFMIALSGIRQVGYENALILLKKRKDHLLLEAARISKSNLQQNALPIEAELIFEYVSYRFEAEIRWIENAIDKIQRKL